jgi:hypothetical protein
MAARATAVKTMGMVLRASVRKLIWTDMAPSWAKAVAVTG